MLLGQIITMTNETNTHDDFYEKTKPYWAQVVLLVALFVALITNT
jgi:hypothetical protein